MSEIKIIGAPTARAGEHQPDRAASEPHTSALATGTQLGPFTIEAVLGAGGFGITYRVRHAALNKQFALKEYFPHQFAYREATNVCASATATKDYVWGLDRFEKEAQALAKFKHSAIVDVSDIFTTNNTAYMVLAYENAPNLAEWLRELGRPPTQDELDQIVAPLLDALELVHAHNMFHRDIAPDNILVRADGSPVLIDFGAARDDLQHRSGPITAVVKPGYSPPEQYEAEASRQGPWSDIYGFGATLYFAVIGALPVDAEDRFDARVRTAAAKKALGFYRQGFLAAIDWALELEPAARPQTVREWRARLLGDVPETRVGHAPKEPDFDITPSKRVSHITRAAVLAVLIAGLALPPLLWPCRILGLSCPGRDSVSRPSGARPIEIEIAMPKKTYAIGDNLRFSLRSNKDCHFLVYTLGPSDEVEQHDPTEKSVFMGNIMLKAGEWRQIPVEGFATVKPPAGNFELGAICSKEPLGKLGLSGAQLREPARGGRRSFSFALENATKAVRRDDLARATVGYEVKQ